MTSPTEMMPTSCVPFKTGTLAMWRSLILPMTSSTSSSKRQVTGVPVMTSATSSRPKPSPRLWMMRSVSRSLKIPISRPRVVDDGKGTNIVLDELGNGLAHGRAAIDRDQAATFGIKDISYKHKRLPETCNERGRRIANLPSDALDLRIWKCDVEPS